MTGRKTGRCVILEDVMKSCVTQSGSSQSCSKEFPYPMRRLVVDSSETPDVLGNNASQSPSQPQISLSQPPHRERPNPFCVSQVQPGAIPFLFEPNCLSEWEANDPVKYEQCFYESMARGLEGRTGIGLLHLSSIFEQYGFCAQIVGPHGGGKSTLMLELATILKQSNHRVFYYSLHDHQRSFPREFHEKLNEWLNSDLTSGKRIVFLDGFEQLSWFHRVGFRYFCKCRQLGMLLSTHSPALGLPILYRTATSRRTLGLILEYLLDESDFRVDENLVDV
ncbi:MAG: ATP-binding protein, partial [Planctomycetia bacterium]|nr:ATP-binding protein [Planctomycetia bacterium]